MQLIITRVPVPMYLLPAVAVPVSLPKTSLTIHLLLISLIEVNQPAKHSSTEQIDFFRWFVCDILGWKIL